MEGATIELTIQIRLFEWELSKRVSTINNHGNPSRSSKFHDLLDWIDLPRHEDHLADEDEFGSLRDSPFERLDQVLVALGRGWHGDLNELNTLASPPLFDRCDHARIVLVGGQHFVARLQVYAEEAGFQRFASVSRDGDLFRIDAKESRKPTSNRLNLRLQCPPHVEAWGLVAELEIPPKRILDDARRGADTTVVEIGDVPIQDEGLLDLSPEIFVGGVVEAQRRCPPKGALKEVKSVVSESDRCDRSG